MSFAYDSLGAIRLGEKTRQSSGTSSRVRALHAPSGDIDGVVPVSNLG
jgi:hypothetical protein